MKQLVIFDLDGTLLNTIGDLAACCNQVLEARELPTHTNDEYCTFVGNGIQKLVERALPEKLRTEEYVAQVKAEFVEVYTQNIAVHTEPYKHIVELVKRLKSNDVTLAVASNKFQKGVEKLVAHYFEGIHFAAVLGQRPNVPLKPSPQIVRDILQITSFTPDKALYIGDSATDMQTATAAGIDSVGVTWGFRTREELEQCGAKHIVDDPLQILELI